MEYGRYRLIYEYYKSQILFGYYRVGDPLPTIGLLCEVYHVAPQTVRHALLQLQQEGFIRLCPGKKTVVTHATSPEEGLCYSQDYYLARRDSLQDLDKAMQILVFPFLREGCRLLGARELCSIREAMLHYEKGDYYLSYNCNDVLTLTLHNRLAFDLMYEMLSFIQVPYFFSRSKPISYAPQRFSHLARQAVEACEREDRDRLYQVFLQIHYFLGENIGSFVADAARERHAQGRVPFCWNICWDRRQVCYSLAAALIERILVHREFVPGDFLPVYEELSSEYGVSFSTVRRAVELLEGLGVVKTSRGIGTKVIPLAPETAALQHTAMGNSASLFQQGVQMLLLGMRSILEQYYTDFSNERLGACIEELRALQREGPSFQPLFICIGHLFQVSSQPLQEIWGKLREILLLFLPALQCPANLQTLGPQLAPHCHELLYSLQTGKPGLFHDSLKGFLSLACSAVERMAGGQQAAETPPGAVHPPLFAP